MEAFLITALFSFGGVCIIIGITIFHYFKGKVDDCISERIKVYFSSPSGSSLTSSLQQGKLPLPAVKDFYRDLLKILEPNRRLRSLLLVFPLDGLMFVLSASVASLPSIFGESLSFFASTIDLLSTSILFLGFAMFLYAIFQLIKLTQDLT